MSQSSPDKPSLSPDDALPPVEAPNAGFIVQLFVVPGVIVAAIVMVWLLFNWVARGNDDPQQYFRDLQRSGPGRWQAAANLADALRGGQHEEFKKNKQAAGELAALLNKELDRDEDDGALEEEPITLRIFLCRVLGEFHVDTGLPALLRATQIERADEERHVRRAAITSIAVLAANLAALDPPQQLDSSELLPTLTQLARDDADMIRESTAYALGLVGGEEAIQLLKQLLHDPVVNVRYNATTGLARHGQAEAITGLEEMLDTNQDLALESELDPGRRPYKRLEIARSGLAATRALADANRQADLSPLLTAAEELAAADLDKQIAAEAKQTIELLKARQTSGS